ncbi:MAG: SufE family protein [Minwuia sp.]|uniref:SufE family protein n=1 Tax=Minwuia sp. TaxID=2493630 RepID=UPI003A8781A2
MARAEYEEFAETLDALDDEDMRFEYILDLAKAQDREGFPEAWMTDENLMHGCMSRVWIVHDKQGDAHYFKGASEAAIVKGLVHMMTRSFSGLTGQEIAEFSVEDVRRLNLGALTFQRQVGMMAMLKHMQKLAGRAPAENEA